jgi:pSer/pThr/pTyr-binding forkhead associated (FHA) protein
MWLLTIEDDEGAVSNHALSGDQCTVGRAPDRDLVLSEVNISRRHARFERRSNDWYVIDEGSYNGTFVNGCAIRSKALTLLEKGDTVQFGGYRIGLSVGEPIRELPPPPAPLTPARLRVIAGLSIGAEFPIERHDFVTIGSADDCTIVFAHENVSPLHATIRTLPGGRYELCDRSKTGLIFVNGHPLIGEQVLEGGDAVDIGGIALFRFLEPSQWPDPRFDMVSNPDAWLSVDVAPYDERPTLDELPDPDDSAGFNEPVVVVDIPTPPPPTPVVAVAVSVAAVPPVRGSGSVLSGAPVVVPAARISELAVPAARISGIPAPPPSRSSGTPVPARSPGTPVPASPPARNAGTPGPAVPPARGSGTPVPAVPPARISGTAERVEADESLPVSSRRQMLATLKRLASW